MHLDDRTPISSGPSALRLAPGLTDCKNCDQSAANTNTQANCDALLTLLGVQLFQGAPLVHKDALLFTRLILSSIGWAEVHADVDVVGLVSYTRARACARVASLLIEQLLIAG